LDHYLLMRRLAGARADRKATFGLTPAHYRALRLEGARRTEQRSLSRPVTLG
jgi:hypothetical protein